VGLAAIMTGMSLTLSFDGFRRVARLTRQGMAGAVAHRTAPDRLREA